MLKWLRSMLEVCRPVACCKRSERLVFPPVAALCRERMRGRRMSTLLSSSNCPPLHRAARGGRIIVGITSAQSCLLLAGRLRALREAGFEVTLVCSPGPLLERTALAEGVRSIALPIERGITPWRDLHSFFALCNVLRTVQPDLVEFSTPKAGLLGTLAARFCGTPVRIYFLRGLKMEGVRGLKRWFLLQAEKLAAASAHLVLCNSPSLRGAALAWHIAQAEKLHLLGAGSSNGVDVERFCPGASDLRQQLGIAPEAFVIGFVGRLTRDKGIPELLCAFGAIHAAEPSACLLLIGWFDASDDALSEADKRRILSDPAIYYTGFMADTAPCYRAMDLLVLPSWREGFPNVVLEAAASALPVVTTLSTGARDSVLPEVTGLLIPPGYPEAITESVLRLLRNEPLRHSMGSAARAWVIEHFVNQHVLAMITELYRELIEHSQKN